MASDLGPWTRLVEEHRRNLSRLDATQPAPPVWWGLPLGVLTPWLLFVVAITGQDPTVVRTAVLCFVGLIPIGFACLFVQRLQIVTAGLVLGIGGSLFAGAVLLG
jgi:hypothetical protein